VTTEGLRDRVPTKRNEVAPAFDSHHAPDPELIADCVHCGFCLPSCPTYVLWGEEMDSPRGRIVLMRTVSEGSTGLTPSVVSHFDRCLGCMACVTACPSGVQYDKLIEATRGQVERRYERSSTDRWYRDMLFRVFPYSDRLRALIPLMWLYQRLPMQGVTQALAKRGGLISRMGMLGTIAPAVRLSMLSERLPRTAAARSTRRGRVGMLAGCVQDAFFGNVNAATVRVLTAEGFDVVVPRGQGCCGALSLHSGREDEGIRFAKQIVDTFERAEVDTIITNSAGCGSAMKDYSYLLRDEPDYAERAARLAEKVRDVSEVLASVTPQAKRHPLPVRVAYHDACHLRHAQHVIEQPRAMLASIPELEVVDIAESDLCCGSAGIYNLTEPQAARQLGERKARNVLMTKPDVLAAGNPGCLLQIGSALHALGTDIPTVHPVELLDASIRGSSVSEVAGTRR